LPFNSGFQYTNLRSYINSSATGDGFLINNYDYKEMQCPKCKGEMVQGLCRIISKPQGRLSWPGLQATEEIVLVQNEKRRVVTVCLWEPSAVRNVGSWSSTPTLNSQRNELANKALDRTAMSAVSRACHALFSGNVCTM